MSILLFLDSQRISTGDPGSIPEFLEQKLLTRCRALAAILVRQKFSTIEPKFPMLIAVPLRVAHFHSVQLGAANFQQRRPLF